MSAGSICTIGYHRTDGARHWVIRRGLEERGWTVLDAPTTTPGLFAKLRDVRRLLRQHRSADCFLVTYPGQYLLPFVRLFTLGWGTPVLLDAFISVYDTKVSDRRLYSPADPRAWFLWALDWLSGRLAHAVLIDTPEHAAFFTRAFRVSPRKLLVVPIGCRSDVFHPRPAAAAAAQSPMDVVFHGTFIPLQGIDTILHAARLLQDRGVPTTITLIGRGQTAPDMERLAEELQLRNVRFAGMQTMEQIAQALAAAGCALGIFGTGDKAQRVIPHKAYEIIACGCALITGDTPSSRAVFRDGETALLVPCGDAAALADAICRLAADAHLCERLQRQGAALAASAFTPFTIVGELDAWLRQH